MLLDEAVEQVPIDSLTPFDGNPRVGDVAALATSLQVNGQFRPLVVRAETNQILAGNHTWRAAKTLGWATVAISRLHGLTDEQATRIVLADNRYSDLASYDDQALADLLATVTDFDGTGYDRSDLDSLLASLEASQPATALTDPDDVPDLPEVAQSVLGDVWSLGKHRLLVGSATESLEALMQGDQAHIVITDPPYNVNYEGGTGLKIENDKLLASDFQQLLKDAYTQAAEVTRLGGPIYVFHADTERVAFETCAEDAGWTIRQNLVWVKNSLVMGRNDYHWKHEPILYGWRAGAAHQWAGDRKQTTVIEWDRPSKSALHPTMKPVGLIQYLLANSSRPGDIVLDPFGGSGSTLIACHQEHRVARLVELDPKYADVILRRYMEHTGDTPTNQHGEPFSGRR